MGDARAQFGQIAQFLLRQVDLPEQGIGEYFVQLGEKPVLVGGGEIAQIEVIGFCQPQQDLRRHRALVALDQVDIARRNAEALGDLGLRQSQLLPDAPEARADKQLLPRFCGHGSLTDHCSHSGACEARTRNLEVPDRRSAPSGMTSNSTLFCDKNDKMTSITCSYVT